MKRIIIWAPALAILALAALASVGYSNASAQRDPAPITAAK